MSEALRERLQPIYNYVEEKAKQLLLELYQKTVLEHEEYIDQAPSDIAYYLERIGLINIIIPSYSLSLLPAGRGIAEGLYIEEKAKNPDFPK